MPINDVELNLIPEDSKYDSTCWEKTYEPDMLCLFVVDTEKCLHVVVCNHVQVYAFKSLTKEVHLQGTLSGVASVGKRYNVLKIKFYHPRKDYDSDFLYLVNTKDSLYELGFYALDFKVIEEALEIAQNKMCMNQKRQSSNYFDIGLCSTQNMYRKKNGNGVPMPRMKNSNAKQCY